MQDASGIPRVKCEVVVVGAGAAGLTAAIAAAELGARTIVLEKAPDISNTNTSRSGGYIAFAKEREIRPDGRRLSVEEKVEEAIRETRGRVDPALIRAWRENIDDTLEWLERTGLKFATTLPKTFPKSATRLALGGGAGLNKQLFSLARGHGCEVHFRSKARKLLTDNAGHVVGVRAMTGERLKDFEADAVVLATAGFQSNQEMLLKYFGPDFTYGMRLTGSPFSTGDGHVMAQEIGAKLVNMDQFHSRNAGAGWVPGSRGEPGARGLQPVLQLCIFVNKLGKRFMSEVTISNDIACSIMAQPENVMAVIFDEAVRATDPEHVASIEKEYVAADIPFIRANTLEELAARIGVEGEALRTTVDEFNKAVRDGAALDLDVPKPERAMKIQTAPFYAIYPCWSGVNCTLGGPKISPRAQVVDVDDNPIGGLYAAGEMIGGFYFGSYLTTRDGATYYRGNYQVTTSSLSTCVTFGRIAGRNAAGMSRRPG